MKKQQIIESQLAIDVDLHEYIILVQDLLTDLIESQPGTNCTSMFNSQEVPAISLEAYMRRLHKFTKYSKQCLILAIVYLDRYNMTEPEFVLSRHNVHRILLTCLMLAVKFHDDVYFDNQTFQKAGGVHLHLLSEYELEVFSKIGYNCYVQNQEYEALVQKLYSVYAPDEEQ